MAGRYQASFVSIYWGRRTTDYNSPLVILSFEGTMEAAFNQIRQFSTGNIAVIIRLMEALITINQFASLEEQRKVIKKHAELVLSTGKNCIQQQRDLDDLMARAKQIIPN